MNEQPASDYDSPWKEAIERYVEAFMAFFFPQAYAEMDWTKGYEFLDKELQQVVRDAELGQRRVDKLVKVWRKNGQEAWVLVHAEVQSYEESGFAERMYVYNYRLFDRYHRQVASFAVLGDERATWRPNQFGYHLWGCEVGFTFPIVKLLDYRNQWSALEESRNPFAKVVMAHMKAQETRQTPENRLEWKLSLVKGLYEQGFCREDILELFRFIDWLLALPDAFAHRFEAEMIRYEEEKQMPYITSIERSATQQGLQQERELILEAVDERFGEIPSAVSSTIHQIEDHDRLKTLLRQVIRAVSLAEFQRSLNGGDGQQSSGD